MLTAWLDEELALLEAQVLRRTLRPADPALVNFASNDYLGLAQHPTVIAGAEAALHQWGAGAAASRLISGHTSLHAALEKALAEFVRQEAALVFSSGYMANLGAITALAASSDAILLDRLCHASLVDAARLSGARLFVYRHADAGDAERVLKRTQNYRRRILIAESLYSMDGDVPPLGALRELARRYDALAVVDEAHALGVAGPEGRGLSETWDVVLGTLSKAFGAQGGFVAGSRVLIDYLINKARPFIFTTGLAPACAGGALAALKTMTQMPALRSTLRDRAERLRDGVVRRGWSTLGSESQIIPLLVGEAAAALSLSARLRERGFFAPAIRPPAVPAGACRLRLSVTSRHTEQDIDGLLTALGEHHE